MPNLYHPLLGLQLELNGQHEASKNETIARQYLYAKHTCAHSLPTGVDCSFFVLIPYYYYASHSFPAITEEICWQTNKLYRNISWIRCYDIYTLYH